MTVSYSKSKSEGGGYYLEGLGEPDLDGPGNSRSLSAHWWVAGDAEAAKKTLGVDNGHAFDVPDMQKFKLLLQGFGPVGGQGRNRLVHNAGSSRRVGLHDFTLSAPKSVSVLWGLGDPELQSGIAMAQRRAAKAYVTFMGERAAYSRRGRGGAVRLPCTIASVLFGHGTSRADDPQLHTHCVVLNVTVSADGSTGALETLKMMHWQGVAASLYHSELALELRKLGFGIAQQGSLFEVEGVPAGVCEAFSQRRRMALQAANREMMEMRFNPILFSPSRQLMKKAVLKTRLPKTGMPQSELELTWMHRAEALAFGRDEIKNLRRVAASSVTRSTEFAKKVREKIARSSGPIGEYAFRRSFTEIVVSLMGMAPASEICAIADEALTECTAAESSDQIPTQLAFPNKPLSIPYDDDQGDICGDRPGNLGLMKFGHHEFFNADPCETQRWREFVRQ